MTRKSYEASFVQAMASVPLNLVTEIREDPDCPGSYMVFLDPRVDSEEEGFVSAEKVYQDWLCDCTWDLEVQFVDDDALYPSVLGGWERPVFTASRIVYKRTQDADVRGRNPLGPSGYPDFAKVLANRVPVRIEGGHPDPSNTVEVQFHPSISIETQAGRGNDRDWLLLVEELLLEGRNVGLSIGWDGLGKSLSELAPRIPVDESQVVHCRHCNGALTLGSVQWAQFLRDLGDTWFFCSHEHQAQYRYSRTTPDELALRIAEDAVRYVRQYRFYGCRVDDLDETEIEKVLTDWCANEPFRNPMRTRVYRALDGLGYTGRGGFNSRTHFNPFTSLG